MLFVRLGRRYRNASMKDKVVIITGGSSGIGKAMAEEFGKNGSKILITARKQELLFTVRDELKAKGIIIEAFVADSGLEDDNRKMIDEAVRLYGSIDILICNAGISM